MLWKISKFKLEQGSKLRSMATNHPLTAHWAPLLGSWRDMPLDGKRKKSTIYNVICKLLIPAPWTLDKIWSCVHGPWWFNTEEVIHVAYIFPIPNLKEVVISYSTVFLNKFQTRALFTLNSYLCISLINWILTFKFW